MNNNTTDWYTIIKDGKEQFAQMTPDGIRNLFSGLVIPPPYNVVSQVELGSDEDKFIGKTLDNQRGDYAYNAEKYGWDK